jgi:hypothetical protein
MRSNLLARGLGSGLPLAGVILVGLVAVTTAMTVLGTGAMPSIVAPSVVATPSPTTTFATPRASMPEVYPTVALPSYTPGTGTETIRLRGAGGFWKVQFDYPQLVADTTPLAYLVNLDIATEVQTRVDTYVAGPASIPDPSGATNWLIGNYTVELLTPRVACMVLRWTDNSASKEQPRYGFQALNYDLASGRRIDLGEVFADQPAALNIISVEARTQLRSQLGGDYVADVVEGGTEPLAANFTGWSLTAEGLKITLDLYQVAGYKYGLPVVVIPWSRLAVVVRADGPAAAIAGLLPA